MKFEEAMFISSFISPRLSEIKHPSPPSLELKQCPSGHPNVIFNSDLHSTDVFLENKSCCAMDILLSATCFYKDHHHLLVLIYKLFRRMVVDAYVSIVPHASTSIADPVDTLCYSPYSLNDSAQCFIVKLGTTPPMIAAR
jgi:hypothetical protein